METLQPKDRVVESRRVRTIRDLTASQRWLVQMMSVDQFGRIEQLRFEAGQPAPDHNVKMIRSSRPGRADAGLKAPVSDDPELKRAVLDLIDEMDRLQNGFILRLEFRHGLPFLLETVAADTDHR